MFAMNRALIGAGVYTLDEFRDADRADAAPGVPRRRRYYERWFAAIRTLSSRRAC